MNKNAINLSSLLFSILLIAIILFANSGYFHTCYLSVWCQRWIIDTASILTPFLLPFLPLFLFSVITFRARESIYRPWYRLTIWWIPISLLLILITPPAEVGGSFGPQLSLGKGDVAFVTSALYAIISFCIVVWTWVVSHDKKQ